MDFTTRMLRLLDNLRRERNGLMADTMRYYGVSYGLNYGVSLPTLRKIARDEQPDHEFACYLYRQDIRELRLAALWIADPLRLTVDEASRWAEGILNSEVAEESALALLGRTPHIREVFDAWTTEGQPLLLQYAALLGASRNPAVTTDCLAAVVGVVHRNPTDRLTAQGAVALFTALCQTEENRPAVLRMIGSLGISPSADFIHEETAWRLEV